MPRFERLSESQVNQYLIEEALKKAREKLLASPPPGLLSESVVIRARTEDGLMVKVGRDQEGVFRHTTSYGDLIWDRDRNLVRSPLRSQMRIFVPSSLAPILTRLMGDPTAVVSWAELYQAKWPQGQTHSRRDRETIRVYIHRLRRLLGETGRQGERQLIFSFRSEEQYSYSLTPFLLNNRVASLEVDPDCYTCRYQSPYGELVLNSGTAKAQSPFKPDQSIQLSWPEANLLSVFMANPGQLLPSRDLVRKTKVNPSYTPSEDDLTRLRLVISHLRVKLGDASFKLIRSVKRLGYLLVVPEDLDGLKPK